MCIAVLSSRHFTNGIWPKLVHCCKSHLRLRPTGDGRCHPIEWKCMTLMMSPVHRFTEMKLVICYRCFCNRNVLLWLLLRLMMLLLTVYKFSNKLTADLYDCLLCMQDVHWLLLVFSC